MFDEHNEVYGRAGSSGIDGRGGSLDFPAPIIYATPTFLPIQRTDSPDPVTGHCEVHTVIDDGRWMRDAADEIQRGMAALRKEKK